MFWTFNAISKNQCNCSRLYYYSFGGSRIKYVIGMTCFVLHVSLKIKYFARNFNAYETNVSKYENIHGKCKVLTAVKMCDNGESAFLRNVVSTYSLSPRDITTHNTNIIRFILFCSLSRISLGFYSTAYTLFLLYFLYLLFHYFP